MAGNEFIRFCILETNRFIFIGISITTQAGAGEHCWAIGSHGLCWQSSSPFLPFQLPLIQWKPFEIVLQYPEI